GGPPNYLKEITRTTDWRDYTLRMLDQLNRFHARHYISVTCSPSCQRTTQTPYEFGRTTERSPRRWVRRLSKSPDNADLLIVRHDYRGGCLSSFQSSPPSRSR